MAFIKIDKSRQSVTDDRPMVTMGSYLADGKAHKGRSVAFRLSNSLVKQLGWQAEKERIKIGVFEGTDKDVGFLQLMLDDYGYTATSKDSTRQGVSISVTIERFKHYVLNECPVSTMVVNHMLDGDALVIECPDWLRFNPQSVPEPESRNVTPIIDREQRRALATRVARNPKR